ncbi:cytochrome b/b6 domain-containing protein [Novosphingobium sp. ST904]|uniref:cytochrome b/b6 domain-containing protein n=1 Tax=Novosphingobium sp. ST904 TaxID=1684385 RepID=UPI0006C8AC69|nr:cytochrome b/b6 domain-containing protein [Novosphingobium sp. ST904]KPH68116.1 hypothetical protein ADT71_01675 [Novosphingobium sp. ST904]TCM23702.1 cytochrome b [Novosphingobium sp. ST904]
MGLRGGVKIWDGPTRLVHWSIVILFCLSWWSAETRRMDIHLWSGAAFLGLLAFRLIWGFFGGSTARFSQFLRSPSRVLAYLRTGNDGTHAIGHNPIGAYSVVAMLAVLAIQVTSGLFSTDIDGIDSGPLSYLISFDLSRSAASVHGYAFDAARILIALHIAAIGYYLVLKRRNLIGPMVTGKIPGVEAGRTAMVPASVLRLVACTVLAFGIAYFIALRQG